MRELTPVQRDLQRLEADLRKLETEYSLYFADRLPRPPLQSRTRLEALVRRLAATHIENAVDRFRFETLTGRFQTYLQLWDRNMRAREEGRPGPPSR